MDDAEAVASELEVVRDLAGAALAEVERRLAMKRLARVTFEQTGCQQERPCMAVGNPGCRPDAP